MLMEMEENTEKHSPEKRRNHVVQFLWMMVVYLLLVYGWALIWTPPGCVLIKSQIHQNLLLMYGCMVTMFFLIRYLLKSPWWLGAFAAVLMMSHPLISTDVLNEKGFYGLSKLLLFLLTLFLYLNFMKIRDREINDCQYSIKIPMSSPIAYLLVLLCFICSLLFGVAPSLLMILLLMELFFGNNTSERYFFLIPPGVVTFLFISQQHTHQTVFPPLFDSFVAPLLFFIIPFPYSPSSIEFMHNWPMICWGIAGIILLIVIWFIYRLNQSGLSFGIVGTIVLMLLLRRDSINLLSGEDANILLIPYSLFTIAIAAICFRIHQHPKWQRAVIGLTSGWALVFFVLRIMRMYGAI